MSWNTQKTDAIGGIVSMSTTMTGGGGDTIHAYIARPDGPGPYPGIVITHHAPGFDEFTREMARRFADHGFITVAPNLYERFGHGTPEEAAAAARAAGGVTDDSVVADAEAALNWIKSQPSSNGKVGVIGPCSGGRHAVLVASRVPGFNAVVDLWGGGVVQAETTPQRPVAPIDLTAQLNAPLLGIFGNDDSSPSPAQVDQHEAALKEHGKTYLFHRYPGATHGIWYYHDPVRYRPQQAMESWDHALAWFSQYLA